MRNLINELLQNTAFGVAITLIAYEIGKYLQRKTEIKLLSPFITGSLFIILILLIGDIDYNNYQRGASIISFFIGPATVSFAIPLYKNLNILKRNLIPIIAGILGGLLMGLFSAYGFSRLFGINELVTVSMLPKAVTSAIGYAITVMVSGVPEIALVLIVVAGVTGYLVGGPILKLLKIKDPIIKGISLGTNSHIIGTAKAMEMGEEEGAMSTAAITIAGLIMVFLVPLFIRVII